MWDALDFRVPYDLKVLPIFNHAHPIITKLTLAFLNLYQQAKKSVHFISSLSWNTADFFRVPWSWVFDHSHPKISNDKHDWNPVKYLNVLHHNRTQKLLQYFFLIFNKLPFWYFGHIWLLSSKIDNLHKKSRTPFITSF